jgi:uracil-DNA glycosylase
MSITYLWLSDILDCGADIICHQCNCISKTGRGLYTVIAERFPHANNYPTRLGPSCPGTIELFGDEGEQKVCAFYAQYYPGKSTSRLIPGGETDTSRDRIKWFGGCLDNFSRENIFGSSVAFPYNIGCGLAGGDWDDYERMIIKFAKDMSGVCDVYIVSLDENPDLRDVNIVDNAVDAVDADDEIGNESVVFFTIDDLYKQSLQIGDFYKKLGDMLEDPISKEKILSIIRGDVPFSREYLEDEDVSAQQILEGDDVEREKYSNYPPEEYTWKNSTLLEFTIDHHPENGWEKFFEALLVSDRGIIKDISQHISLTDNTSIYPPLHLVYEACNRLPLADVKVIIIGQDPYHGEGQAMGIAFAVPPGVKNPPSLVNIFKEARSEGISISENANIADWLEKGVLLINTALTVKEGQAGSHSDKWTKLSGYTRAFMEFLNENCGTPDDGSPGSGVVVVMWGNHAKSFDKYFGPRHKKIYGVHPSPLSAYRGFFGSKPCGQINKQLKILGYDPIDWTL